MPYYRRRQYRRKYRRRYVKKSSNYKNVRRIVRQEIKKDDKRDHPLQWVDVKWTGNYIKTTPSLLSLTEAVKNHLSNNNAFITWPIRYDSTTSDSYRQADFYITGCQYQMRFEQNSEAVDPVIDTVRALMYSFKKEYPALTAPILSGGDVDQPPRTDYVNRMFMDRLFSLTAK